jgi:hypothetical protein
LRKRDFQRVRNADGDNLSIAALVVNLGFQTLEQKGNGYMRKPATMTVVSLPQKGYMALVESLRYTTQSVLTYEAMIGWLQEKYSIPPEELAQLFQAGMLNADIQAHVDKRFSH